MVFTDFLDAFLGAFLGVWAASPGMWAGPVPIGPLLIVLLAFLAMYLQALRFAVQAPSNSVARGMHRAILAVLCVQIIMIVALGAYSHSVSWSANLGYGTLMVTWMASVYARPWLREVATTLETVRMTSGVTVGEESSSGGEDHE